MIADQTAVIATMPAEFVATFPVTIDVVRPGCYWGFDLSVAFDVARGRTVGIRLGIVHYDGVDRHGDDWREWCRRDHPEQISEFERYVARSLFTSVHRAALRAAVQQLEKLR